MLRDEFDDAVLELGDVALVLELRRFGRRCHRFSQDTHYHFFCERVLMFCHNHEAITTPSCQTIDRDLESFSVVRRRMLGDVLVRQPNRDLESVSASFCAKPWICACLTTDRDLDSSNTTKRVNAWPCALPTTDRDPASVIPNKKRKSVTTTIFSGPNVFF